jgi:hypothetical protein
LEKGWGYRAVDFWILAIKISSLKCGDGTAAAFLPVCVYKNPGGKSHWGVRTDKKSGR